MQTFLLLLASHEQESPATDDRALRVQSPSRAVLDRFMAAHGLRRWLEAEPTAEASPQEGEGIDAVLHDQGDAVGVTDGQGNRENGFGLAQRWRVRACRAAIRRHTQEAAELLAELIDLIDSSGGLTTNPEGSVVPVADDWPDLAMLYADACGLVPVAPLRAVDENA